MMILQKSFDGLRLSSVEDGIKAEESVFLEMSFR